VEVTNRLNDTVEIAAKEYFTREKHNSAKKQSMATTDSRRNHHHHHSNSPLKNSEKK